MFDERRISKSSVGFAFGFGVFEDKFVNSGPLFFIFYYFFLSLNIFFCFFFFCFLFFVFCFLFLFFGFKIRSWISQATNSKLFLRRFISFISFSFFFSSLVSISSPSSPNKIIQHFRSQICRVYTLSLYKKIC